jgi:hypothetical protein
MANTKISALTSATTPLAGTEVLPIVQSSATKQVSVANLTAGRAISATAVTATTGNFVVGTSGQGIDFSATPGTGTSELFADYEEGTYTATMTPETSGTITLNAGINELSYTKMGRIVTITGLLYVDSVSSPVGTYVAVSLPTTIADLTDLAGRFGTTCYGKSTTLPLIGFESTSAVRIIVTASTVAAGNEFWLSFSYVSA